MSIPTCWETNPCEQEISNQLGITMNTVRTHLQHIYEKLHVQSRTAAVLKFLGRWPTGGRSSSDRQPPGIALIFLEFGFPNSQFYRPLFLF
jgi:hypothetical protein